MPAAVASRRPTTEPVIRRQSTKCHHAKPDIADDNLDDSFVSRPAQSSHQEVMGQQVNASRDIRPHPMRILIKTCHGKVFPLDVHASDTIGSVKLRIESIEGFSSGSSTLVFNGQLLGGPDSRALCYYNIKNDARLVYWTSVS